MASLAMRLYQPTPRQTNLLIALGAAAFGYAFYLRFLVIEAESVAIACAAGLPRGACILRKLALDLSQPQLFGFAALAAALVHLYRPRFAAFAVALIAAIFGLLLYNNGLAALAVALLVMGFARPVRIDSPRPVAPARPRTTTPASSRRSR